VLPEIQAAAEGRVSFDVLDSPEEAAWRDNNPAGTSEVFEKMVNYLKVNSQLLNARVCFLMPLSAVPEVCRRLKEVEHT
jgi:hypothetical protein